jgi:hypothetical protein
MTMTASSALSSMRMSTLCQGEPFTLTDSPFASASEMIACCLVSESPLSSFSESSGVNPSEATKGYEVLVNEDRMKVTETEDISRTERARRGDQGRMECHSDDEVEVEVIECVCGQVMELERSEPPSTDPPPIRRLHKSLINRIAAGEVGYRTLSSIQHLKVGLRLFTDPPPLSRSSLRTVSMQTPALYASLSKTVV